MKWTVFLNSLYKHVKIFMVNLNFGLHNAFLDTVDTKIKGIIITVQTGHRFHLTKLSVKKSFVVDTRVL